MNYKLHAISEQLLCQLNANISRLQAQEKTLTNDMENFQSLHKLYNDIRYARISNKASLGPSVTMERELKAIYEHLIRVINQLHDRQKGRLLQIYSELLKEKLKHPQINTVQKIELRTFFSRVTLC